jgi:hypothetical protein
MQLIKTASIISIERPVKISSTVLYNSSSPFYSLRSSWVFSQPKSHGRMVEYPCYTAAAFESGNIQFLLDSPCRVNPCIVHMNQSQGFATFFGIWRHFLNEWTEQFFIKEQ